jgi:hypothetical protein
MEKDTAIFPCLQFDMVIYVKPAHSIGDMAENFPHMTLFAKGKI